MGGGLDSIHKLVGGLAKGLFGVKEPKATPPPDPQAAVADAEAEARRKEAEARRKAEERRRRLAAGGRSSTFQTSQMGLSSAAPIKKKTLLGS